MPTICTQAGLPYKIDPNTAYILYHRNSGGLLQGELYFDAVEDNSGRRWPYLFSVANAATTNSKILEGALMQDLHKFMPDAPVPRTVKRLKTRLFHFGDGHHTIHRYAVFHGDKRIGSVQHVVAAPGVQWFDPLRLNNSSGDGKLVTQDHIIQRKTTLGQAVAEV